MISESNVELEKSYQKKHKKVDNEVDSHMNGLSENNKDAVKNLILNKDVNSVKNNERTEKEPSGQKRVFKSWENYKIAKFLLGYVMEQQLNA